MGEFRKSDLSRGKSCDAFFARAKKNKVNVMKNKLSKMADNVRGAAELTPDSWPA